jgi:collagenase-like PrtC family protease
MALTANPAKLTMGPLLFNWQPEQWRDFYLRIAEEAPVDTVYLGEVVCSKRAPFFMPHVTEVAERLEGAGKEVVFSTLALVMNKIERDSVRATATDLDTIEVNDISAIPYLAGRPHVIGPMINCYNEETLRVFVKKGAKRICLPVELPLASIRKLTAAANELGAEVEILSFGRMPLAISARCYHARVHKLSKDSCKFICDQDPDGLALDTLDDEKFLTINGVATMSHSCVNLIGDLESIRDAGVNNFRLSPHSCDMVQVARLFRDVLDATTPPSEAYNKMPALDFNAPFSNGYLHGKPGMTMV